MVDAVQPLEAWQQFVDHRGGQRRHRTGAAADQHAGTARGAVEFVDAADELARVRQVDVMGAGADGGTGDAVILPLEGTGGGNHQVHLQLVEAAGQGRLVHIQAHRLAAHLRGQLIGAALVASADQDADSFDTAQTPYDQAAEVAVAPEHQHAKFSFHSH